MKPECSRASKEGKISRVSLQVLQPAAGDKENLVGGSRQTVTNMKVGVKLGEKCGKSKSVNEKNVEHTMLKGNLKKKKVNVAHKSVQTNKDEEKPQINSADLMSDGPPSENYWQLLAEKRRIALEESLQENKTLHQKLEILVEEKQLTEQMLEESRNLVDVLKEILAAGENEESQIDSEGESSS
ncbi:geminin [Zootermopsis nevadensis]|uniref:Geminin n=1 Tax=Zootermopsis nevadensis TaxID=136037 RepID=A0A067R7F9_ZOONE|nr:geminin [Zootermopsis nevadensis]KDR18404.1 hypothetical protein L798_07566 [Zootermopsis nevadensis]